MTESASASASTSLLDRQKQTNSMLQQLLKETSAKLYSGPDSASAESNQQLFEKYKQAKENLSTAPLQYRSAQRNYYVQTKGQQYYTNALEKEYGAKAEKAAKELEVQIGKNISSTEQLNQYLADGMKKSEYVFDLYDTVQEENSELKTNVAKSINITATSDRQVFYDMDKYDNLQQKYDYLIIAFYVLVFILALFIIQATLAAIRSIISYIKAAVIIIVIALFPMYVDYLWQRLTRLYGLVTGAEQSYA